MLVNIDVKNLEWVTVVWFSQDPVGMAEIYQGVDQHALNQKVFGLPSRDLAKIFVFRLIYGGSKWAYALDSDFNFVSKSANYWQKVIDRFYEKYSGIQRQHASWVREAISTGSLVMPTGRFFKFEPYPNKYGGMEWPRTQILNYPVQGTGHDLVTIARVSLARRINDHPILSLCTKFISTVHDSIVLDVNFNSYDGRMVELVNVVRSVFNDIPDNFERLFKVKFNLPIQAEISYGNNLLDTEVWG